MVAKTLGKFGRVFMAVLLAGVLCLPAPVAFAAGTQLTPSSIRTQDVENQAGEDDATDLNDLEGLCVYAAGTEGADELIPDQVFTGSPIKPQIIVEYCPSTPEEEGENLDIDEGDDGDGEAKSDDEAGLVTLVENVDYTVSYANNVNVGTATVTVSGIGKYTGEDVSWFEIVACPMSNVTASAIATQAYTGKEIKPAVTLKNGDNTLRNTDYALTYQNNTAVGTATITAMAKSKNYTGSKKITFQIAKTSINNATVAAIANQTYTGKAITPSPAVKLGSKTLEKRTDYTLSYKGNTAVGTATVTVTGKGVYTGSVSKTFKIVQASMSKAAIAAIPAKTYSGSALKPAPKVTFSGKALKKGADYTLSWKNNVKAGTAKVTVTGKGNFADSKSATFKINKASIAKAKVASVGTAKYTGRAIKPSPAVKLGGKALKKGTDYTLSYKNNVNAGTATIVVTGKGNYKGTRTTTFRIVKPATPKSNTSSTVYITKSGKKFHRDGCSSLKKSKIAISRSDAVKKGYEACKNCRP